MNFEWQLINDSITKEDKKALTDFINEDNVRFTQGARVREFEDTASIRGAVNKVKHLLKIETI